MDISKIATNIESILKHLDNDPKREGLLKTPSRSAKALAELTSGYRQDIDAIVGDGLFSCESSEMVLVRDIEFYSLCEHHLLPFFGKAHVAYLPQKKIIGLSKIPRIVNAFARRLQVQERLTHQISETLQEIIQPAGVAVIIEADHLCMMMRGVQKQSSRTITSSVLGEFRDNPMTRSEFFQLIGRTG